MSIEQSECTIPNCTNEHHSEPPVTVQVDLAEQAAKKYPGPSELIHLHAHTLFSTLDGVAAPDEYIDRAKYLGMDAMAITDHGSLGGIPDAYFAAKSSGIKLIAGIEAYINEYHQQLADMKAQDISIGDLPTDNPNFLPDDQLQSRIRRNRHMIILAQNQQGWKNLLKLTAESWKNGFYYKPRMWMDMIRPYKEGLIMLSGCLNGPISYELMHAVKAKKLGQSTLATCYYKRAIEWVTRLKDEFADNFFFEIQMPGPDIAEGYDVLGLSLKLAKKFNVKTVLTGDSHYLHKEDFIVQRAMMAIDQDTTIDDPEMFIIDTCEGYMKSRAQFRETFHEQGYEKVALINDIETACDNSLLVAAKCETFQPDLTPKLPEIQDADAILAKLAAEGLAKRGLHKNTKKYYIDGKYVTYVEQTKIELARIKEKKFSSYFLITRNLVMKSRLLGYDVGPARGSAGGSLVCFLIGIHDMNSPEWGLSFDRFLSMTRGGYMLKCDME